MYVHTNHYKYAMRIPSWAGMRVGTRVFVASDPSWRDSYASKSKHLQVLLWISNHRRITCLGTKIQTQAERQALLIIATEEQAVERLAICGPLPCRLAFGLFSSFCSQPIIVFAPKHPILFTSMFFWKFRKTAAWLRSLFYALWPGADSICRDRLWQHRQKDACGQGRGLQDKCCMGILSTLLE